VMDYDLSLIALVDDTLNSDKERLILDVGIGTGWPIASSLLSLDYKISGVDISSSLINKCLEDHPNIHSEVGDSENMPHESESFDLVYCFHSSSLFPDLMKAIYEMFRVRKKSGVVLIDMLNINNWGVNKNFQQHVFENSNFIGILFKTVKNLAKFILREGTQDWPFLISQTPSDPGMVIEECLLSGGKAWVYSWLNNSLQEITVSDGDKYRDHSRVVISCKF
jgi:ubiquinone/menaquinone biosynthesis C-methylase UbiE